MADNTIEITGTGGIIEGNLATANVDVNLDAVLDFNGSSDYITVAHHASLNFGDASNDDPFSVSAWIRMDTTANFTVLSKGVFGTTLEYKFGTNGDSDLELFLCDESGNYYESAKTSVNLTAYAGTWIHVAATYNGVGGTSANAGITLYVNGVAVAMDLGGAGTYAAMENGSAALHIGRYDSNYSEGEIADVRIYNTALDGTTEIPVLASKIGIDNAVVQSTDTRVGHWMLTVKNSGSLLNELDDDGTEAALYIDDGTDFEAGQYILLGDQVDLIDSIDTSSSHYINLDTPRGKAGTSTAQHADNTPVYIIGLEDLSTNSNAPTLVGDLTTPSGDIVYDAFSVNVQDTMTTTGTTTVTQGKLEGKTLTSTGTMDGSADYFSYASDIDLVRTTDYTLAAWFKTGDSTQATISRMQNPIWGDTATPVDTYQADVGVDDGKACWHTYNNGTSTWEKIYGSTTVSDSEWHHVCFVHNSDRTVEIYVDGVLDGSGTEAQAIDFPSDMIGKTKGSFHWSGNLRDVRIHTGIAYSAAQVSSLYSNSFNVTPTYRYELTPTGTTQSATEVISHTGTASANNATGASMLWTNGTLDLDGTLTIDAEGTLSAPRGNLTIAGGGDAFDNNGTDPTTSFEHNDGTVTIDGGNMALRGGASSTGTHFYNLTQDGSGHVDGYERYTVENKLTTKVGVSYYMNGDNYIYIGKSGVRAGEFEINGAMNFTTDGRCYIEGAGGPTLPALITYDGSHSGASGATGEDTAYVHLTNTNWAGALTTGSTNFKLLGDAEFDAVTVSSGAELDLNGQRMECSGILTNSGLINSTGGGLLVAHNNINMVGGAEKLHDGDLNVITDGGTGHNWRLGTATGNGGGPWCRNVLINDDITNSAQIGAGTGSSLYNPESVIVGNGKLTQSGGHAYLKDLTIATGGDLEMTHGSSKTIDLYGDFTTSGGLLGASCLSFTSDKTGDADQTAYAHIPDHADLDFANSRNALTLECWFKVDHNDTVDYLFDRRIGGEPHYVFFLHVDSTSNSLIGQIFTSGTTNPLNGTAVVNDQKWHHCALVYKGSTGEHSLYIDGKLDAQEIGSGTINASTSYMQFGGRFQFNAGHFLDGEMDEIRMFAAAKTAAEIRADMFKAEGTALAHYNALADANGDGTAEQDGLIGRWSCNAGTGDSLVSTGNTDVNATIYDYNSGSLDAPSVNVWAGGGGFAIGDSTLVMTGTSKKITWTGNETVRNLTISGTTTLEEINGNDGYLQWNGILTVDASKTLGATSAERLICNSSGDTIVINNPTGLSGLYSLETLHSSGTISIPEMTVPRLKIYSGGTVQATGDHTFTQDLRVENGIYNVNGNAIVCKYVAVSADGTLNLSNSTMNFSTDSGDTWTMHSDSTLTTGNTTITGYGTGTSRVPTTLPSAGGFEVVGDVKWLALAADSDLTVVGAVIDCDASASGANIRQWHHTLDTQQLLDADSGGDDDLRLTKPALDNSHELMTG